MLSRAAATAVLITALLAAAVEATPMTFRLEPQVVAEGVLSDEAAHVYETELAVGRSWRLEVTAAGNEAQVSLTGALARPLMARTLFGLGWSEVLTWKTQTAEPLRITLRAAAFGGPVGPYRLLLRPVADQAPRDRRALLAALSMTEGVERYTRASDAAVENPQAREEALRQAATAFEEALQHWQGLERKQAELRAQMSLARVFLALGEPARAATRLGAALPLASAPEQASLRALLLDRLGYAHLLQGDVERARRSLVEALELWRQPSAQLGEWRTRGSLCLISMRQGAWEEARHCYEGLLAQLHGAEEARLASDLHSSLGGVYAKLGEPDQAIASYDRALALSRATGDVSSQAQIRNNLGALHRALGDPEQGIAHYREALAVFRQRGDLYWQGRTLNNLGYAYLTLGDLDRARSFFQDALELRRRVEDRSGEAVTLNNLGRVALRQGDPAAAIAAHSDVLALARTTKNRRREATTLLLLGEALQAQQDIAAAGEHLDRALEIRRQLGDRPGTAGVLLSHGEVLLDGGDGDAACVSFAEALDLYHQVRDPFGETEARYALARAERQRGYPDAARQQFETVLADLESLRAEITDPSRRASFLGARRGAFELLIDVLMDLHQADPTAGHHRAALAVSERARARTLLDLLEQPAAALDHSIRGERQERLQRARRRLAAKVQRQLQVLGGQPDDATAATVRSEVYEALTELESVHAEVRRASPRFAALSAAEPLATEAIQRLLDPGTLLLEIVLGERRSFLFAVTSDELASFELPGRKMIEDLARQTHRQLTQLDLRSRRSRREAANELSRLILTPVAALLRAHQRLVVVADGALHYVPFATLPIPATDQTAERLLIEGWQVVHLPSASALSAQRRLRATRQAAPKTLAVLADPVFNASDPRLERPPSRPEHPPVAREAVVDRLRPAPLSGSMSFDRLSHSREEASAITALVPPDQALSLLGLDAHRERVLSAELAAYRILHFATHGLIHPQHPELSGLVLSQVDAEGRPRDGFLSLHDLLGLELGADLVVLSGCQTALGKEVPGEGFVGLARGFLYAGVPQVVASLWQVEDQATAELTRRFYRGYLKEGKPAATAMREAQLAIRKERRWQDPFFWGAFVFQGDWR